MMRRLAMPLIALLVLASAPAWAQAPATMPLQMNLTDAAGAAVTGSVVATFEIYDTETPGTGTLLWGPEDHTVTTDDGVISVLLGNGDDPVPLSPAIFDGSVRYLSVVVDGGSEMNPRLPIGSSAYALSAHKAAQSSAVLTRIRYTGSTTQTPTGAYVLMRSLGAFSKRQAGSAVRLTWQGHLHNASPGSGFCELQLRIDGAADDGSTATGFQFGRMGSMVAYGADQGFNISTVFRGLSTGSHTVQAWLRGLNSTSCVLNLGNFQQEVLVEEFTPAAFNEVTAKAEDGQAERFLGGVETGRF